MERVCDKILMSTVSSHFHQFSLESLNETYVLGIVHE